MAGDPGLTTEDLIGYTKPVVRKKKQIFWSFMLEQMI